MTFRIYIAVAIALLALSAQSAPPKGVKGKIPLKAAKDSFKKGDCTGVVSLLGQRDLAQDLNDESQFVETYEMLGVCYFKTGDTQNALNEFTNLLFLRPEHELDPFVTPPPLLEAFNKLKDDMKAKSKELEIAKEKVNDKPLIVEKEITYRRVSLLTAFVPFGVGQFENGQRTKGIVIAASEAALLGANIGFYWWKRSLVSPDGLVGADSSGQYNTAQILQFVAIGAFAGVCAYGIIDALLNREPIVQESVVMKPVDQSTEEFLKELNRAQKK
jgi:hypothetical protein